MINKRFPPTLKSQVWQYLHNQWENKKDIKIEESEVFSLLNYDLQEKVTLYMNGAILLQMQALNPFTTSPHPECIEFISRVAFYAVVQKYAIDEYIFEVGALTQLIGRRRGQGYVFHSLRSRGSYSQEDSFLS